MIYEASYVTIHQIAVEKLSRLYFLWSSISRSSRVSRLRVSTNLKLRIFVHWPEVRILNWIFENSELIECSISPQNKWQTEWFLSILFQRNVSDVLHVNLTTFHVSLSDPFPKDSEKYWSFEYSFGKRPEASNVPFTKYWHF